MGMDFAIVMAYIAVIVMVGISRSKQIKTLRDFSLSGHTYGTFALTATLSASFIGGGFSTGNAAKAAVYGIGNILALWGFSVSLILVGIFIVPKVKTFKSAKSTGEIMGRAYGRPAQILTGFFSMLVCAGILGAQVGAIGYMFNVFLGVSPVIGIVIGCTAVIAYSTLGGMSAVVSADVIQFCILAVCMPMLLYFSLKAAGGLDTVIHATPKENFNIFNGSTPLGFFSLMLTLALGEALVPPYVQRLLMGNSTSTTRRATVLSGFISLPFFIITGLIGMAGAVYFAGTATDMNSVMQSMIMSAAPVGIRGLIIASMLAIVMSSADSFLNSASVGIVCDVILPLSKKRLSDEQALRLIKWVNLITGTLAVLTAVAIPNILDVLTFAYTFWSPLILIPLAAALLGCKAPPQAFYISMLCGGGIMIIWTYMLNNPLGVSGLVAGSLAALAAFILFSTTQK